MSLIGSATWLGRHYCVRSPSHCAIGPSQQHHNLKMRQVRHLVEVPFKPDLCLTRSDICNPSSCIMSDLKSDQSVCDQGTEPTFGWATADELRARRKCVVSESVIVISVS